MYRVLWLAIIFLSLLGAHAQTLAHKDNKYAAIVVDAASGRILYQEKAHELRFPASLTKMMVLYLLFKKLDQGKITLATRFKVSKRAAQRPPSKLGLKAGQTISVKEAILALIVKSANDVASTVADGLSGSESAFAQLMNQEAKKIGMTHTSFRNASGLPHPKQKTTARDMARLCRALLQHFPRYYPYFKTTHFHFNKRQYRSHNLLIGRIAGVDGIKTGYTRLSGFNLATSVMRDNKRLIVVVMGGKTGRTRDDQVTNLLERSYKKQPHLILAYRPITTQAQTYFARVPVPQYKPVILTGNQVFAAKHITSPIKPAIVQAAASASSFVPSSNTCLMRGWNIQVGAYSREDRALAVASKIKASLPHLLKPYNIITSRVDEQSKSPYRAQFSGFTRDEAENVCHLLRETGFDCLLVKSDKPSMHCLPKLAIN